MDIEKLREEIEYDEGSVNEIYLDHLAFTYLYIGILLENQTQNTDGKSEHLLVTIDAEPSTKISKQSCQTATSYTQTLMICQESFKE